MKYLLLLHMDPDATADPPAAEGAPDAPILDWNAYSEALLDAGALVSGEGLEPAHTVTTVQLRRGERIVTDGPFVETKDLLLGFYVIDVENVDEALDWAVRLPLPGRLTVEVWPVPAAEASASGKLEQAAG